MAHGLRSSTTCGILVPRPGIKPMSPALEGRFLITGPPGESPGFIFLRLPPCPLILASFRRACSVGRGSHLMSKEFSSWAHGDPAPSHREWGQSPPNPTPSHCEDTHHNGCSTRARPSKRHRGDLHSHPMQTARPQDGGLPRPAPGRSELGTQSCLDTIAGTELLGPRRVLRPG